MGSLSNPDLDARLRQHRVLSVVFALLLVTACAAVCLVLWEPRALLPVLPGLGLILWGYYSGVRHIHYLDYRVRKTEKITRECETSSAELRQHLDAGVNVWSSNGPPQA